MAEVASNSNARDKNGMLIFAYLIPLLAGWTIFALYNENPKLRFHGLQAGVFWLFSLIVIGLISPFVAPTVTYAGFLNVQIIQNPFGWVPEFLFLLAWIYGIYIGYNAFSGNDAKARIPLMAEIATQAEPK